MKKTFLYNLLKGVFVTALLLSFGQAKSQSTTVSQTSSTAVKLVDNKGTIKYIQTLNGLTTIVGATDKPTTTTYQLGGTLTADTYIDRAGSIFALDGIELETGSAAINPVTDEVAKGNSTPGTGYTLLVRDEETGAVKKLALSSLIDGGLVEVEVTANVASGGSLTIGASGATLGATLTGISSSSKTWVHRNGVKLNGIGTTSSPIDYTIDSTPGSELVTITAPFLGIQDGDVIAIQWY